MLAQTFRFARLHYIVRFQFEVVWWIYDYVRKAVPLVWCLIWKRIVLWSLWGNQQDRPFDYRPTDRRTHRFVLKLKTRNLVQDYILIERLPFRCENPSWWTLLTIIMKGQPQILHSAFDQSTDLLSLWSHPTLALIIITFQAGGPLPSKLYRIFSMQ